MSLPTLIVEAAFTVGADTSNYLTLDDVARGILDTNTWGATSVWEDITPYGRSVRTDRQGTRGENRGPVWRYSAGIATVELNDPDRRFDPTNLSGPYTSAGVTQVTPMRAIRIRAIWNGVTYALFRGFADAWQTRYDEKGRVAFCTLTATDGVKVLSAFNRGAVAAVGAGENTGARTTRILNSASWSTTDRIIAGGNTTVQSTTLEGNVWDELLLVQDTEIGEVYVDEAGRVVFRSRQQMLEELRSISAQATFGDTPLVNTQTTVNLVLNPSLETNTTGWIPGGSVPPTLTQSAVQALFGTKSLLITWDTGGFLPLANYTLTNLTVGKTYTASLYVYVPAGDPDVILALGGISFGTSTALKDQWVRLTLTFTASSPTAHAIQIWPLTSPTAGDLCYVDGFQVEEGSTTTIYCDGDQASSEWDGAAHASSSRRLPELPYSDVTLNYDDTTVANYERIARVGGVEQTAQDTASQQLYLIHTHQRDDLLMQTDTVAEDYADFALYQSKDPELRFGAIEIRPQRDETNLFPQALGRRFGDRIRIKRRPPGSGTITRETFIRGISHETDGESWTTTWTLQSATTWSFLILDHVTLGKLDENALGF